VHFWPHRAWFFGGTALALLTALWGIGYVAVLDYVGNSLQAQMTGDASGAPTGWIWSGIAAIIFASGLYIFYREARARKAADRQRPEELKGPAP